MKKRVVLTLIIVSAFAYLSNAQLLKDLYKIYDPVSKNINYSDSSIFTQQGIVKPGKPVYNVTFGTGYTSFGSGMGFSNSYISPTVAYSPNEKMTVVVGASLSYTNFNNIPNIQNSLTTGNVKQSGGNPTEAFAYGQYNLSNKFSVYAMGSFGKNQLYISPYQVGVGRTDYQQLGVGFNYKISNKVSIGASLNYSNEPGLGMGISPNRFNSFNPIFP